MPGSQKRWYASDPWELLKGETVRKLKIGRFSYSNLFPIFYMLERESDCRQYEFIEGVPSELNRRLRLGEIDISPSSSIEYLRNSALYDLVPDHSISSEGPVRSIFLFSRKPLEALGGETVLVTSQSETSVALLRIILTKFLGLSCRFRQTAGQVQQTMKSHAACLLIGDDALLQALKWRDMHIYDLGELWTRQTGLPFTFALWLVRKDSMPEKKELIKGFILDLDRAKKHALTALRTIAPASPFSDILSVEELVQYWQGISYDFNSKHRQGLALFRQFAEELGLLQ